MPPFFLRRKVTRLARFDLCRDAAIRLQTGAKRTRHQRTESVENDPQETFAAKFRCNAGWAACRYAGLFRDDDIQARTVNRDELPPPARL